MVDLTCLWGAVFPTLKRAGAWRVSPGFTHLTDDPLNSMTVVEGYTASAICPSSFLLVPLLRSADLLEL